MKKIKDLEVGDIVYGLYDCSRLKLFKVKEIKEVKPYTENSPFVRYRVVLVEMDDRMWGTFNLYSDKTEFDDYDITGLTYFLNKEEVKELLIDTLNEVTESFELLEEIITKMMTQEELKEYAIKVNYKSTPPFTDTYFVTKSEMGKVLMFKEEPRKHLCTWNGKYFWTANSAGIKVPTKYFPDLTYENSPMKVVIKLN